MGINGLNTILFAKSAFSECDTYIFLVTREMLVADRKARAGLTFSVVSRVAWMKKHCICASEKSTVAAMVSPRRWDARFKIMTATCFALRAMSNRLGERSSSAETWLLNKIARLMACFACRRSVDLDKIETASKVPLLD